MSEATAWHAREPAADEAIVGAREADERFAGDAPDIHDAGGEHPDGDDAQNVIHGDTSLLQVQVTVAGYKLKST